MDRRTFLTGLPAAGLLMASRPVAASVGTIEKPDLTLSVGGKPTTFYLPLTLAERLRFFEKEGLNVTIQDLHAGSKSLQALMGGSVDVTVGAYEHTIHMQAQGKALKAVVLMGQNIGICLGIRKSRAASYKSPRDLKGMKIGITAPGSSTDFFVRHLLASVGMDVSDVSLISTGTGATPVAAMRHGEIDAVVNSDPSITQLEGTGEIEVVLDTRRREGSKAVYGGPYPASALYLFPTFIERYPNTTQALVNVFVRTLRWMKTATPDDIANTVPSEYLLGSRDLYKASIEKSSEMYSSDGLIDPAVLNNALKVLSAFDERVRKANVNIANTYDDRFVKRAQSLV